MANKTQKTRSPAAQAASPTKKKTAVPREKERALASVSAPVSEATAHAVRGLAELDALAEVFSALGSGPRLRMLFLLHYQPDLTVGELSSLLGVSLSGVSMHLRRLRTNGLVATRRDGQTVCCALYSDSPHVRALRELFDGISGKTGCCR